MTVGVTLDAVLEVDGKVSITGGSGNDTITASASANFGDTIVAGAGNDTVQVAYDGLTSADAIAGGDGTDTIKFTTAGAVEDVDFTSVTGIEIAATNGAKMTDLILGANALAAGITTVTFSDTDDHDKVTVGAGFTRDLTVNLDADTDGNNIAARHIPDPHYYS